MIVDSKYLEDTIRIIRARRNRIKNNPIAIFDTMALQKLDAELNRFHYQVINTIDRFKKETNDEVDS